MTERPAILVTGGAGFIGSHACKALAQATIPSKPSKFDACQSLYYAGR